MQTLIGLQFSEIQTPKEANDEIKSKRKTFSLVSDNERNTFPLVSDNDVEKATVYNGELKTPHQHFISSVS